MRSMHFAIGSNCRISVCDRMSVDMKHDPEDETREHAPAPQECQIAGVRRTTARDLPGRQGILGTDRRDTNLSRTDV